MAAREPRLFRYHQHLPKAVNAVTKSQHRKRSNFQIELSEAHQNRYQLKVKHKSSGKGQGFKQIERHETCSWRRSISEMEDDAAKWTIGQEWDGEHRGMWYRGEEHTEEGSAWSWLFVWDIIWIAAEVETNTSFKPAWLGQNWHLERKRCSRELS